MRLKRSEYYDYCTLLSALLSGLSEVTDATAKIRESAVSSDECAVWFEAMSGQVFAAWALIKACFAVIVPLYQRFMVESPISTPATSGLRSPISDFDFRFWLQSQMLGSCQSACCLELLCWPMRCQRKRLRRYLLVGASRNLLVSNPSIRVHGLFRLRI